MNETVDVMRAITSTNTLEKMREIREQETEKDKRCSSGKAKGDPE